MLKSIQWKLVMIFILLVVSVMIVVGVFLLRSIADFYHDDFRDKVAHVLDNDNFKTAAESAALVGVDKLEEQLKTYTGRLGIDSYRNYFILNGLGEVLAGYNDEIGENLEFTDNIISAMAGKNGTKVYTNRDYVDYAMPLLIEGKTKYIIYIRDEKVDLQGMMEDIFRIIFEALFFGLFISIVLGFLLSNTITTPIATLTRKAEEIAMGNFDQLIEVRSEDEIGKLTNTFNNMAGKLKRNLEQIASEKNKLETILKYMEDGVIAFNLNGHLIHINPAAIRMLEIQQAEEVIFDDFFHNMGINISIEKLIYSEHLETLEEQIDLEDTHLKVYFATFKIEKERVGGVVVVLQDITEQQKLDNARREFVANVSHELRTPLTSVKSYTETLLDGAVENKGTARHFLEVINNETDRMTRLVKDLLLLSRLDYQKTDWQVERFSLEDTLNDVVEKLSLRAKNYGHSILLNVKNKIPAIYGDKQRIEQVLKNILSNAIKYTPENGKILISAGKTENSEREEVYISIKDNGIGVPQEDISRIFERFYRVDKARSREQGGTGLGLAIAKEIITAHSGTITINSETNQGTEVIIHLPVYPVNKDECLSMLQNSKEG